MSVVSRRDREVSRPGARPRVCQNRPRRRAPDLAPSEGHGPYGQPADRDLIGRLLDAGANRVVVRPATVKTEAAMAAELTRIAETVLR
jgi:hypothetical protein